MIKKTVSIFLAIATFTLLIFSSISVFADNEARSSYTSSVTSSLKLSSSQATCISDVNGKNNVTKITITQTLQKKSSSGAWTDITSFNKTYYSKSFEFTNKYYSSLKGTYRVKSYVKVYVGEKYETTTKYSSTQTV